MSGGEWGSLNDILGRLEDVDEDLRDVSEDVDTAVGTANAKRLCESAREAVGDLRELIEAARAAALRDGGQ